MISPEEVVKTTAFDPWFVQHMADIIHIQHTILRKGLTLDRLDAADFRKLKRYGYTDVHIAKLLNVPEMQVRERRKALGVIPSYYRVDTCAAEFEAHTPYLYSTYEQEDEAPLHAKAGLTEWPVVLRGSFDESFLSVPGECLTTSMKSHQK